MPPKSRKRKATPAKEAVVEANGAVTVPDRATWSGWVEMESEPAFFNVMLKDMGIRGVKIQEVYGLDDESLAILPRPVHALIFLFRYRETDQDQLGTECPKHVWFAEQVPDFACASVALLNIINNIPGLDMGKDLRDFKAFTQDMDPHSRGDAIDDFTFVKKIHNAFASDNDILVADMYYKEKTAAANKRQAVIKARKTKAANVAAKAVKASAAVEDDEQSEDELAAPTKQVKSKATPSSAESTKAATPAPVPSIEAVASPLPPTKPKPTTISTPAECAKPKAQTPTTRSSGRVTRSTSKALPSASPLPATRKSTKKGKVTNGKVTNGTVKMNRKGMNLDGAVADSDSELTELSSSPAQAPSIKDASKDLKTKAAEPKPDPDGNFKSTTKTSPTPNIQRSGREPKPRKDLALNGHDNRDTPQRATNGKKAAAVDEEADEEGFHFCAYMPIGDHVWKLDGMDKFPQDMGVFDAEKGLGWLSIAQPELQGRMLQYQEGAIEFNLMSLVHDPLVGNVEALSANVKALQEIEKKLTALVDDWKEMEGTEISREVATGLNAEFGVTQVDLDNAEVSENFQKQLAEATDDLFALIEMRKDKVSQQSSLRAACRDELESWKSDAEHARHRRHDYQGMVKQWFEALAEQEQLSGLIDGI